MTTAPAPTLILWDIDRTLLYVGDFDRQVYREAFADVVGRPAAVFPARGTGMTMPLAIQGFLRDNGVAEEDIADFTRRMIEQLPTRLSGHRAAIRERGILMPGAVEALRAVHEHPDLIPTVVTGNLRSSALIKLTTLGLDRFLDAALGGYSSDDPHRPALVAIAQRNAHRRHGAVFTRANTVIIGDSLEDVRTGIEGGARVIGVASGTTTPEQLTRAGADIVLPGLKDVPGLMAAIASGGA
ncbi:HAD hydrolase-like protein [Streptomyces alkaliphilus]|uniref:HAD hydrolase-like protein n=1 Tax=Streptomyces alkaliphilus TaxID=1472722 RepID=A0A7W3Y0S2_9ACTN|nr:haloacid dehalogenase-like hydrolase [Streptomyces alkaliphilus]MBB0243596.1 HAD hydrolase-like protein [Streptomyces alkaliphilus]